MKNIAIFASGSGSNAENIHSFFLNNSNIKIKLIIANKKDAYVIERGKRLSIETMVFENRIWKEEPENILRVLKNKDIDFIVLAGFLLKVPKDIIESYPNKIVNIHPALLPKYGGKGMYGDNVHKAVIDNKEKKSGITIHYINENYDEGDIIFQAECDVTPDDNYITLAKKVHELEYKHFPIIINKCINDEK